MAQEIAQGNVNYLFSDSGDGLCKNKSYTKERERKKKPLNILRENGKNKMQPIIGREQRKGQ